MAANYLRRRAAGESIQQRLEHRVRPQVMDLTVGQSQRPHPRRIASREDLADSCSGVIADQVDLIDLQRIEHRHQRGGLRGEGGILPGADAGVAEAHQIRRQASACRREVFHYFAPLETVERKGVQEKRHRPATALGKRDLGELGVGESTRRMEL
jgi:hypothetical protein